MAQTWYIWYITGATRVRPNFVQWMAGVITNYVISLLSSIFYLHLMHKNTSIFCNSFQNASDKNAKNYATSVERLQHGVGGCQIGYFWATSSDEDGWRLGIPISNCTTQIDGRLPWRRPDTEALFTLVALCGGIHLSPVDAVHNVPVIKIFVHPFV